MVVWSCRICSDSELPVGLCCGSLEPHGMRLALHIWVPPCPHSLAPHASGRLSHAQAASTEQPELILATASCPSMLCSFICDELDGRFARMFGQTTMLGQVLDMVTDR